MCALVAILLLLLYVLWLMRQRDQRLRVTVDIVLQLTNSRNFARFHNMRVIKIHNELVERLNDQYERELRENGDAPREIDSATLPASSSLALSGQSADSISEQQTEASGSEQTQEVSSIPSVAATSEFGIESGSQFKAAGFKRKSPVVDNDGTPTAQSDVDIALARANAAAAGEQPAAGTDAKGEESLEVKNRRLEAQVQALQQRTTSLRNQLNQQRQASAVGGSDNSGEPQ
jgi:chaperonin cofactor prefoldin